MRRPLLSLSLATTLLLAALVGAQTPGALEPNPASATVSATSPDSLAAPKPLASATDSIRTSETTKPVTADSIAKPAPSPAPDSTPKPTSVTAPTGRDSTPNPGQRPPRPERYNQMDMGLRGGHGPHTYNTPPPQMDGPPPPLPVDAMVAELPYDEDSLLEIKLKTDPEAARRYRSPRKAFFFSLLLPGAGQAYCGSWAKMAVFAAAEIGLGVGWYQVAVVASRDKAREARQYAASHWRQQKYEAQWQKVFGNTTDASSPLRAATAPWRESYCHSLYGDDLTNGLTGCLEAPATVDYSLHTSLFGTGGIHSTDSGFWNQQQMLDLRDSKIKQIDQFHDLIGRYSEFTTGWEDTPDSVSLRGIMIYSAALDARATDPSLAMPLTPWGYSQMQANYRALRTRSDDLARTQKWFLGGMVLNHLVSALDAALQAGRMNRELLHLETSWLDHIEVGGGLAVVPQISSYATLAWRF